MNQVSDPNSELDDLLAECDLPAPSVPEPDDLDALLAESVQLRDAEREMKAARERLKRRYTSGSGRTAQEIAEDEARVRAWEAANLWDNVAGIAQWEKHRCVNCGRGQTIFRQLMLKQRHRETPNTWRWQSVDEIPEGLPQENLVQKWETGMCTHCAGEFGFDFKEVPVGEWL